MISMLSSTTMTMAPTRSLAGFIQDVAPVDTLAGSAPSPPAAPPQKKASVGQIVMRTAIAAAEGAFAGMLGGTWGGIIGGLSGFGEGGRLGWNAGAAASLALAEKTGQGKVNPIAGGIGALAMPFGGAFVGAGIGTTVMAIAGAQGNPVVGAAIGGGMALLAELIKP